MSSRKSKNKHLIHMRRTIGSNIHNVRLRKKITLAKLSGLTSIPSWKLDHFEMGKSEMELSQLIKISQTLKIDTTSLFKFNDKPLVTWH